MKTVLSMLAGMLYSAAYIAPRPYWAIALITSCILVAIMRLI